MNLKQRIDQMWAEIGVDNISPVSPFVGSIWHFDIDRMIHNLRDRLIWLDGFNARHRGEDDMSKLDGYLRLKEPWRYED